MKFIHAADVHLDSPLRGLARYEGAPLEEIRGATRRAFENLVDLAIHEKVAFVLLAGDLYDGDWKDYNTGLFFTSQMSRLHEAGIKVFLVAGNHDAANRITRYLRPPENVHIFSTHKPETVVLEYFGVAIHGQGFPKMSVTEDLSQAYPLAHTGLFNIGLLHTSLDGRVGHASYAPCTVDGLRSRGYQYWALGHVHQREIVAKEPWIVFPGNTQGRHARETGSKGCTLVTVTNGQVDNVEHYPLDTVRWMLCRVDVSDMVDLDDVYDQVEQTLDTMSAQAEGQLLAVRLQLTGACAVHAKLRVEREQVTNQCRALASNSNLWVEKVLIKTQGVVSEAAALARDDAFGGLLRSIRDLELDTVQRLNLVSEFNQLNRKLPIELRSGDDAFDLHDPDFLRECLVDVKEILLERLLTQDDSE